MRRKRMRRNGFVTISPSGRKKRMPKTISIFGKRFKVYPSEWKLVQKLELMEFKKKRK